MIQDLHLKSRAFFTVMWLASSSWIMANTKDQPLLQLEGRSLTMKDLPADIQQRLFNVDVESYNRKRLLIEEILVERYLEKLAKQKNRPVEKLKAELLDAKSPTEKELKDFYNKNKKLIPYSFEQAKGEIEKYLKRQQQLAKHSELVQQAKKALKFKLLIEPPTPPQFDIPYEKYPGKGNKKAALVVVEFGDYQCPHCQEAFEAFHQAWPKIKDKIYYVFIDYPFNPSGISRKVAEAAYCAHQQGKFWEYHSLAYTEQSSLNQASPQQFAQKLKLDIKKFNACLADKATKKYVEEAKQLGIRLGIQGTPAIFFNGAPQNFRLTSQELIEQVNNYLKRKK